uniref:Cystatin domain-containing protein n=1 Tax=Strongyloides venezuelensis TaxID=75913 RepID=A0A0K0FBL6_STRVS
MYTKVSKQLKYKRTKNLSFSLEFKMKYFSIIIVLAMVIFVTINARKRPCRTTPRRTTPDPKEWHSWDGKYPLDAIYIAKEATRLFKKCGYNNFKFLKVTKMEKRILLGTWRYKVDYNAQRCEVIQKPKPCKNKKKYEPDIEIKFEKCQKGYKKFQAIFRDNIIHSSLRLNVTNLENSNSCALVIKYNPR